MKNFLNLPRETPESRTVEQRLQDWKEVYLPFPEESIKAQGSRCMDCGVPFCQSENGCPVDNLIPEWNRWAAQGDYQAAIQRLQATNNFPEFTGRLCPAPCESACVLGISQKPVSIRAIEQSIVDKAFEMNWIQPQKAANKTGKKVAIVGSGPAGLAAAQQLARKGHEVEVFEKAEAPGGLLRFGIPDFKMEKTVLDRRLQQMRDEGVVFTNSRELGKNLQLEYLQKNFDAVALCLGAEKARSLNLPGSELQGVHYAMDFLSESNRVQAGTISEHRFSAQGKRIIILGGGDTGSDVLGTSLRQGATQIYQLEILPKPPETRSEQTPWPLWPHQLKSSHAHEEGGVRLWGHRSVRVVSARELKGSEFSEDQVGGLEVEVLAYEGNQVKFVEKVYTLECDMVILAMGFVGVNGQTTDWGSQLRWTERGTIATQVGYRTHKKCIYTSGDARRGASLIVWAIKEGREMAEQIHRELE